MDLFLLKNLLSRNRPKSGYIYHLKKRWRSCSVFNLNKKKNMEEQSKIIITISVYIIIEGYKNILSIFLLLKNGDQRLSLLHNIVQRMTS